jgi:hypothetical protein
MSGALHPSPSKKRVRRVWWPVKGPKELNTHDVRPSANIT